MSLILILFLVLAKRRMNINRYMLIQISPGPILNPNAFIKIRNLMVFLQKNYLINQMK